jgi:hypothetical protein
MDLAYSGGDHGIEILVEDPSTRVGAIINIETREALALRDFLNELYPPDEAGPRGEL